MKKTHKLISQNISTIAVVLRTDKPSLLEHFLKIKEIFKKYNISIFLDELSAHSISKSSEFYKNYFDDIQINTIKKICKKSDMLICCGGDGTLLHLVKHSFRYKKPILGISGGNLSFLLNVKLNDLNFFVDSIFDDKCKINKHMMLVAKSKNKEIGHICNEIVFKSNDVTRASTFDLYVNDELVNSYLADGLIISTPIGSTAYNLSANGPILYPTSKAIIVTPICPHGLTQSPIVFPCDFKLSVSSKYFNNVVIIDGVKSHNMENKTKIDIEISKYNIRMINLKNEYLKTLREKLLWGK